MDKKRKDFPVNDPGIESSGSGGSSSFLTSLLNSGLSAFTATTNANTAAANAKAASKSSKTLLYLGIGAIILVVIVLVLRRK